MENSSESEGGSNRQSLDSNDITAAGETNELREDDSRESCSHEVEEQLDYLKQHSRAATDELAREEFQANRASPEPSTAFTAEAPSTIDTAEHSIEELRDKITTTELLIQLVNNRERESLSNGLLHSSLAVNPLSGSREHKEALRTAENGAKDDRSAEGHGASGDSNRVGPRSTPCEQGENCLPLVDCKDFAASHTFERERIVDSSLTKEFSDADELLDTSREGYCEDVTVLEGAENQIPAEEEDGHASDDSELRRSDSCIDYRGEDELMESAHEHAEESPLQATGLKSYADVNKAQKALGKGLSEIQTFAHQVVTNAEQAFDCLSPLSPAPNVSQNEQKNVTNVHEDERAADKRAGVENFLKVPLRLEKLLALGFFICLDEFLTQFTTLPQRCLGSLWPKRASGLRADVDRRVQVALDWVHLSMLILTALSLYVYNISWVYHNIRGQNVIKLYVIYNIVEIFDGLCSSFGIDVFDMLGSGVAGTVKFLSEEDTIPRGDRRMVLALSLVARTALDYFISWCYSFIHGSLLLAWAVTLNVSINSAAGNTIMVLLVSNNFIELKAVALKPFKLQNLFQIAMRDAVERIQMSLFVIAIVAYTRGDFRVGMTWFTIFLFEIVVDWIKHSSTAKFNGMKYVAYNSFSLVISRDLVASKKHLTTTSIGGSNISKRLGFVTLPMGAFVVRMLGSFIWSLPYTHILLLIALMFLMKVSLSIGLLGYCYRKLQRFRVAPRDEEHEEVIRCLCGVNRYSIRKDTCGSADDEQSADLFVTSKALVERKSSETFIFYSIKFWAVKRGAAASTCSLACGIALLSDEYVLRSVHSFDEHL
ncbi:hypothetical protein NDN08_001613 [Rhodosorus marinus]|uniref:Protein TAPT1 homolog n=1 Tax=Rhodosorus marinus TaxID=101924 RepID=A0AAV8URG1_9RHOD|nr:hypothetical protein NDN08_001613 [Rhodosorus marinus]